MARFVVFVDPLPESAGHDGSAQQPVFRHRRSLVIREGEWCPFLTCLERAPHAHDSCWLCEALRSGNAFCGACRSRWHPSADIVALRLRERLN